MSRRFLFILPVLFAFAKNFSQQGDYFVDNFMPQDYSGGANNNGIAQDNDGLIFVANMNDVLIYDGVSWEIVKRNNEASIYSIAKTGAGEIVVGTEFGDIAVITKNHRGKFVYQSLLKDIPEDQRPHDIIRQIIVVGNKTYFLSSDKLVEYQKPSLKFYEPKQKFHARAMVMGQHLYVSDMGEHISVLIDGKLIPLPNSTALSTEKFFSCFRINSKKFVLAYRKLGFMQALYDSLNPTGVNFSKTEAPSNDELLASDVNNGCMLRNGHVILTTNKSGAFELDTTLAIVRRFNTHNGIFDNNVKSVFQDVNGNLWFPLYYGISFIETNSRIYHYDRNRGISGVVQSACFFENKLYIATDKGVQYFDSSSSNFVQLQDFNRQTWYLLPAGDKLLIATTGGLYSYANKKLSKLSEEQTFCLISDPTQKNIYHAGTSAGVQTFEYAAGKFQPLNLYEQGGVIRTMACDAENNVFFVGENHTVYFLNRSKGGKIDSIPPALSLPPQKFETAVFSFKSKVMLGTDRGIYFINKNREGQYHCMKEPNFWKVTQKAQVFRAAQLGDGIICYQKYLNTEKNISEEKITQLVQSPFSSKVRTRVLNHLSYVVPNSLTYDSARHLVNICANEGLFFLKNELIEKREGFKLILKSLITKNDTLLENCANSSEVRERAIKIPYSKNDLTVVLGFTSYETTSDEYSYKLEGLDSKFSSWNAKHAFSFNNLNEGRYTLLIRARTELEERLYELQIPFTVAPPWYRTAYAYAMYVLLFIAFTFMVVRLNSRRLLAQNKKLENTIEERTRVIKAQKMELEHKQTEILDSINYAQRIQRALLASDKVLKANLPSYFVFFKPKDVVSGDFYWASKLSNGHFALLNADSTGHGVPGAIMSMLNISCLKEAVESEKLSSPANILNHTRRKVIETLANDGSREGGKDGMDCSLISFDFNNNKMVYAAAHNPVWVIRDMGSESEQINHESPEYKGAQKKYELIELQPDKMPVGKHDRDHIPFSEHEFELRKGDMVYTLTDGLPDQFGGPKGKKYMYKRLKELLISIADKSLKEQKKVIEDTLTNWKGNLEQVDDICVIGVRI